MKKRILSWMLALAMILSCLPMSIMAAETDAVVDESILFSDDFETQNEDGRPAHVVKRYAPAGTESENWDFWVEPETEDSENDVMVLWALDDTAGTNNRIWVKTDKEFEGSFETQLDVKYAEGISNDSLRMTGVQIPTRLAQEGAGYVDDGADFELRMGPNPFIYFGDQGMRDADMMEGDSRNNAYLRNVKGGKVTMTADTWYTARIIVDETAKTVRAELYNAEGDIIGSRTINIHTQKATEFGIDHNASKTGEGAETYFYVDNLTVKKYEATTPTYTVKAGACENGKVFVDKNAAAYGETVTMTAEPAEGYWNYGFLVNGVMINGAYPDDSQTFVVNELTGNATVTAIFLPETNWYYEGFEGYLPGEAIPINGKTSQIGSEWITGTGTYSVTGDVVDGETVMNITTNNHRVWLKTGDNDTGELPFSGDYSFIARLMIPEGHVGSVDIRNRNIKAAAKTAEGAPGELTFRISSGSGTILDNRTGGTYGIYDAKGNASTYEYGTWLDVKIDVVESEGRVYASFYNESGFRIGYTVVDCVSFAEGPFTFDTNVSTGNVYYDHIMVNEYVPTGEEVIFFEDFEADTGYKAGDDVVINKNGTIRSYSITNSVGTATFPNGTHTVKVAEKDGENVMHVTANNGRRVWLQNPAVAGDYVWETRVMIPWDVAKTTNIRILALGDAGNFELRFNGAANTAGTSSLAVAWGSGTYYKNAWYVVKIFFDATNSKVTARLYDDQGFLVKEVVKENVALTAATAVTMDNFGTQADTGSYNYYWDYFKATREMNPDFAITTGAGVSVDKTTAKAGETVTVTAPAGAKIFVNGRAIEGNTFAMTGKDATVTVGSDVLWGDDFESYQIGSMPVDTSSPKTNWQGWSVYNGDYSRTIVEDGNDKVLKISVADVSTAKASRSWMKSPITFEGSYVYQTDVKLGTNKHVTSFRLRGVNTKGGADLELRFGATPSIYGTGVLTEGEFKAVTSTGAIADGKNACYLIDADGQRVTGLRSGLWYTVRIIVDTTNMKYTAELYTIDGALMGSRTVDIGSLDAAADQWVSIDASTPVNGDGLVYSTFLDNVSVTPYTAVAAPASYAVTTDNVAGGTLSVDKAAPAADEVVTVTAEAAEGYTLAYIMVNGRKLPDNTFVANAAAANGTGAIKVSAKFVSNDVLFYEGFDSFNAGNDVFASSIGFGIFSGSDAEKSSANWNIAEVDGKKALALTSAYAGAKGRTSLWTGSTVFDGDYKLTATFMRPETEGDGAATIRFRGVKAGMNAGTEVELRTEADSIYIYCGTLPADMHIGVDDSWKAYFYDAAGNRVMFERGVWYTVEIAINKSAMVAEFALYNEKGALLGTRSIDLKSVVADAVIVEQFCDYGVATNYIDEITVEAFECDHAGDKIVVTPAVPATCTEPGKTEGKTCKCGHVIKAVEEIEALGHTEVTLPAKEATEEAPGLTEGKQCTVCGVITVPQVEIPYVKPEEKVFYTLSVDAEIVGGTLVVAPEAGKVEAGTAITVTADAAEGYELKAITVNGEAVTADSTYTFAIAADTAISAIFKAIEPETPACDHSDDKLTVTKEAKEATCTDAGWTEEKSCSCGEIIVASEPVEAKGHNLVDIPGKDATYTEPGYKAYKDCSRCDYTEGYEEIPVLPVPTGTIKQSTYTLSLDEVIFINDYVVITGFEGIDLAEKTGLMVFKTDVAEPYFDEKLAIPGAVYDARYNEWMVRTGGIAAKEYADELYVYPYVELPNGEYFFGEKEVFSVRSYCDKVFASASARASLKRVCAAMLHYGAAAQVRFNYKVEDLANAGLAAEWAAEEFKTDMLTATADFTTNIVSTGDVVKSSSSLSLDGAIVMNYYYKCDGIDVDKAELLLWYGETEMLTEANAANADEPTLMKYTYSTTYGAEYFAQSAGIATKKYGETIYSCVKVTDTDGGVHYSEIFKFSPEAYAELMLNHAKNGELVKRMVVYGEAAAAHFAK